MKMTYEASKKENRTSFQRAKVVNASFIIGVRNRMKQIHGLKYP